MTQNQTSNNGRNPWESSSPPPTPVAPIETTGFTKDTNTDVYFKDTASSVSRPWDSSPAPIKEVKPLPKEIQDPTTGVYYPAEYVIDQYKDIRTALETNDFGKVLEGIDIEDIPTGPISSIKTGAKVINNVLDRNAKSDQAKQDFKAYAGMLTNANLEYISPETIKEDLKRFGITVSDRDAKELIVGAANYQVGRERTNEVIGQTGGTPTQQQPIQPQQPPKQPHYGQEDPYLTQQLSMLDATKQEHARESVDFANRILAMAGLDDVARVELNIPTYDFSQFNIKPPEEDSKMQVPEEDSKMQVTQSKEKVNSLEDLISSTTSINITDRGRRQGDEYVKKMAAQGIEVDRETAHKYFSMNRDEIRSLEERMKEVYSEHPRDVIKNIQNHLISDNPQGYRVSYDRLRSELLPLIFENRRLLKTSPVEAWSQDKIKSGQDYLEMARSIVREELVKHYHGDRSESSDNRSRTVY